MGLEVLDHVRRVEVNFNNDEIKEYEKIFQKANKSKRGCVTSVDLRNMLKAMGEDVSEEHLHEVIAEVDTNRNSCVELDEFLQVKKVFFSKLRIIHNLSFFCSSVYRLFRSFFRPFNSSLVLYLFLFTTYLKVGFPFHFPCMASHFPFSRVLLHKIFDAVSNSYY